MIQEFIKQPLNKAWPFWVLNLTPECSNQDVSKAAQLISSKLTLGVANAELFETPSGQKSLDDYLVREAKSILDDPAQRLVAEFWYVSPQLDQAIQTDTQSTHSKTLSIKQWLAALGLKWVV